MKVYIFGNEDLPADNRALETAEKIRTGLKDIEFINIKPNEDLPIINGGRLIMMDVVQGIDKVEVLGAADIDKLILPPRASVHDFDLGWQLKYLKKIGQLNDFMIIGLPMRGDIDYRRIHSILRKLVAQDMQGS